MTLENSAPAGSILVVGGGISGLTTALEAAEVGYDVYIVEKTASLGGRVAQLNQYFPKLCPPTCGLEINYKRIRDNARIKVLTLAEVESVSGGPGAYAVQVKLNPRYVNEHCTCCGACSAAATTEVDDAFNLGMSKVKAAYLPHAMAFPQRYVVAPEIIGTDEAKTVAEACPCKAINLDMQPKVLNLVVGSVVWATGWAPYDAKKIDNLGFGRHANIITNMMLERLASKTGPTTGQILRPSDGKAPKSIAFVQCAGSRDENHLPYCSYICCMASLKHATYIRAQYPDAEIYIYYIDLRAPGYRYEKFYKMLKEDPKVHFIKGKVAAVAEEADGNILVTAENAVTGEKVQQNVDMAVLATGMEPSLAQAKPSADLVFTPEGFIVNDYAKGGQFACGCANKPADVVSSNQNATGMALKAIQTLVRR
ncbi:CoB--CoM heterodisulfide reductase iron-sulfur subunit A family protein [Desulfococcaceae bacterium OttesenSCG-928-F15]|nr:CoB--CoM heterodisulfide reductase iron-sulfur subunit A family protein [Desulfococcaceae bacterium OttesenSCG-928-F15]